jgi:hypothetical protein
MALNTNTNVGGLLGTPGLGEISVFPIAPNFASSGTPAFGTLDGNGNLLSIYGPGGQQMPVTPTYTWAQIQALASPIAGQRVVASDLGYATFVYNGSSWICPHPVTLQPTGGLPFIYPTSGTVGNNGALSGITAVPIAYPSCWMYMPANAIFSGSTAGWYYCTMSSTTAGTLFNNTVSALFATPTGSTAIPATPVAFVTTGPGAFTQSTAEAPWMTWTLPAGLFTANSELTITYRASCANNANAKKVSLYFGGSDQAQNNTLISAAGGVFQFVVSNSGVINSQSIMPNNYGGYAAASGVVSKSSVNWTGSQNVSLTINPGAAASDWVVLEGYKAQMTSGF